MNDQPLITVEKAGFESTISLKVHTFLLSTEGDTIEVFTSDTINNLSHFSLANVIGGNSTSSRIFNDGKDFQFWIKKGILYLCKIY